jgi:hypothetical protein
VEVNCFLAAASGGSSLLDSAGLFPPKAAAESIDYQQLDNDLADSSSSLPKSLEEITVMVGRLVARTLGREAPGASTARVVAAAQSAAVEDKDAAKEKTFSDQEEMLKNEEMVDKTNKTAPSSTAALGLEEPLMTAGLDSLGAVELRNSLQVGADK